MKEKKKSNQNSSPKNQITKEKTDKEIKKEIAYRATYRPLGHLRKSLYTDEENLSIY